MPEYEITVDGKPRKVELARKGERSFAVKLDDRALNVELPDENPDLNAFTVRIDGKAYEIELPRIDRYGAFPVKVDEATFNVEVKIPMRRPESSAFEQTRPAPTITLAPRRITRALEGTVAAPMTGIILSVKVEEGERVEVGQVLCVLEAMKMENEITAPIEGIVLEVFVSDGFSVNEGDPLFVID